MPKGKHSVVIDMTDFEVWSKRSWTDVFLQIYKVTVLGFFWLIYRNSVLVKVQVILL